MSTPADAQLNQQYQQQQSDYAAEQAHLKEVAKLAQFSKWRTNWNNDEITPEDTSTKFYIDANNELWKVTGTQIYKSWWLGSMDTQKVWNNTVTKKPGVEIFTLETKPNGSKGELCQLVRYAKADDEVHVKRYTLGVLRSSMSYKGC